MRNFWFANIRRRLSYCKINFKGLYMPDGVITSKSKVTSFGYNKLLENRVSNKYSNIPTTNCRKPWNYFKFKTIKALCFWNRVSSSIESNELINKFSLNDSKSNFFRSGQCSLQHCSISRDKKLYEGKPVIKHAENQHKFHIIKNIIRDCILKEELYKDLRYVLILFYFNSKFILWHNNFLKMKIDDGFLKLFQQQVKTILNITLLMNIFTSFIWNFNLTSITSNGLNIFAVDENKESDGTKIIKLNLKDHMTKTANNTLEYQLKSSGHSNMLLKLIAKLLNTNPKYIKDEIYKHPKRRFVPKKQVEETCSYLKGRGYGIEVIQHCPTVLFYPREYVENTLKFLESQHFKDENESIDHTDLKLRLHLCVYYMEKPFHFSGEGIFPTDEAEKM